MPYGLNERLRHVGVVGQQLPYVLGQAVADVAKAGVVVLLANAWTQTIAVNHLAVEVGHPHGRIGVGKQLDVLGLDGAGEQGGYIGL